MNSAVDMNSAGVVNSAAVVNSAGVANPAVAAASAAARGRPDRVAVLADSDSRWKWGMLTARQLTADERIDAYQLETTAAPSPRQLAAVGLGTDRATLVRMSGLAETLAGSPPDVLVVALPGGACQAVLHALASGWPAALRRPVVITGYVGVVYQKVVEGLLLRAGFDIVLANSASDARRFRALLAGVGQNPDAIVETALPFLREPASARPAGPFTLTFAGQPGVPASRADRAYLVERLARHARRHPERLVTVKLRSAAGERVTHTEPHPYPDLLDRLVPWPPNLRTVLGDMGTELRRTDLLVTVSSTAALEAMHAGVPTVVLTDFGIRESLGNAYFVGSGCLGSFDDIDDGFAPSADPSWAGRHGIGGSGPARLRARVGELRQVDLPPLEPFYTPRRSPVYLPKLLASYGLALDGRQSEPPPDRGLRRLVRGAIGGAARSLYHSGATVVAPALRRWSIR